MYSVRIIPFISNSLALGFQISDTLDAIDKEDEWESERDGFSDEAAWHWLALGRGHLEFRGGQSDGAPDQLWRVSGQWWDAIDQPHSGQVSTTSIRRRVDAQTDGTSWKEESISESRRKMNVKRMDFLVEDSSHDNWNILFAFFSRLPSFIVIHTCTIFPLTSGLPVLIFDAPLSVTILIDSILSYFCTQLSDSTDDIKTFGSYGFRLTNCRDLLFESEQIHGGSQFPSQKGLQRKILRIRQCRQITR